MLKNYTIKSIAIFAMAFFSFYGYSQDPYTFSDDFESYNVGDYLAKNSATWTTWSNKPGSSEDAKISDTQASSGTKSVFLSSTNANGGPTDLVFPMPELYELGKVVVETKMFVEEGKGAYFNYQGATKIGDAYVIDAYFVNDGNFYMFKDRGAIQVIGTKYPVGEWFDLKISMDLTINSWIVEINGDIKGEFSTLINKIASIDFFPVNGSSVGGNNLSSYYLDDFKVDFTPFEPLDNDGAILNVNALALGLTGFESSISSEIINVGKDTIKSFDIKWYYGDSTFAGSKSISGLNLATLERYIFDFDEKFNLQEGQVVLTVEITSINGGADENADNNIKNFITTAFTAASNKKFLGEELTGTWCGWCPRGAVALEYMSKKYPDHFIGIAVHGGDPMETNDYLPGLVATMTKLDGKAPGYPNLSAMRSVDMNPSSVETSFIRKIQEPAAASLLVGSAYDSDTRSLSVSVTTTYLADNSDKYNVSLILVENGVTGTTSKWAQQNYYSKQSNNIPLVGAGRDWQNSPKVVPASEMVYNDVGRVCIDGYEGKDLGNSHSASEAEIKNFKYTIPAGFDINNLELVAVITNSNGTVNNANRFSFDEALGNGFVEVFENIAYHDLVINEFLASSDSLSGIADQDGEYDDWIEIYNNTNKSISLSNAYLTDNFDKPQVFQFPAGTTIEANSYIIVWADKDTDQDGLHAKFKLSSGGEQIMFSNGDGSIIDSLTYDAQTTNVAFARRPNGTGEFTLQDPTFNANNNTSVVLEIDENILRIYPNPAKDNLNLDLSIGNNDYQISIFNQMGQVIINRNIEKGNSNLDISELKNGLYYLRLYSNKKLVGSTKITVLK